MLLPIDLSFWDPAEDTGIELPIIMLKLPKDLVCKVVDLIFVSLVQNWQCVSSNKT